MDAMIQSVEGDFSYESSPLFWNLIFVPHRDLEQIVFRYHKGMSYSDK
jgi:hypothetical protein